MNIEQAREICQKFALKHKLIFEDEGECGFGRKCVGFISRNGNWLDHNPTNKNFEYIEETKCEHTWPPEGIDAYHKHDCMAVLGRDEEAIIGLAKWVLKLEKIGNVRIVEFQTGAKDSIELILRGGLIGYAVVAG
jgi:hypothetical protein